MNRVFQLTTVLSCAIFLWMPLASLSAQEEQTADPPPAPKALEVEKLTLAGAKAAWAAIENDSGIEDPIKDAVRSKYNKAIESLELAGQYRTAAAGFKKAIETAPAEAEQILQEAADLPSDQDAAELDVVFTSTVELQRDLDARDAGLQTLAGELEKSSKGLTKLREERPTAISARIPAAEAELNKTRTELQASDVSKSETSLGRVGERTMLLAREAQLVAEIEMLNQEKLSLSARDQLLEARSALLSRKVANAKAAIATLKKDKEQRLKEEADAVESVVDSALASLDKNDLLAQSLAAEVGDLATQSDEAQAQDAKVNAAQQRIEGKLKRLKDDFERLSRELKVEGAGSTMAQLAFNLQEHLLDQSVYALRADESIPSLESMRLASIKVDQQIRNHESVAQGLAGRDSEVIDRLIEKRIMTLEGLKSQYKRLIPEMITLEALRKQLDAEGQQVREGLSEQLVWIRSSAPLSVQNLRELPNGVRWLFSIDHWNEFCRALAHNFSRDPFRFLGFLSLVVMLLAMRPRVIRALEATGLDVRRVSLDRYRLTCEALLWTAVLAAPIGILLAVMSWTFSHALEPSAWMRGLAVGTPSAARIAFMLAFASELCRPGGIGNVHFAWKNSTLGRIRKTLFRFGIVYIPAGLIISSTLYGDASQYADGVGRISLMVSKVWTLFLLWRQLGGDQGLVAKLVEQQPQRILTRTWMIWYPLILLSPIAFFVLAARGYVIASIELSRGFAQTLGVVLIGEVVYWMILRWFSMKARGIAVAERMERLRAARDAGTSADQPEAINISSDDEKTLDLATIGMQTRRLARSLVSVTTTLAVLYLWSANFPLAPVLRSVQIPFTDGVDLFEFGQALLILAIAATVIKNLPGALELSIFRESSIEIGTRHAITTLCRYGLGAIGIVAIFNVLNFDWTKFGWMAAAMGVGLGFGMQEVITNFVCGLILLFERPVRIGDVVTIQGVTGTVTKIRMRATTITNWDRQEFVVPNKSLITDTILNWTLSASVSRIVITVGVAYGTKTEEARQLLLDVANDHPIIMKEPAPMATFEQFADSSLTLCLRCYVPDLDYRLRTISELHTEIDNRFSEAGIEIAFPQQDLHLRTGFEKLQPQVRSEAAQYPS